MADLNGSLNFEDISKWKVADLKKELKSRGLNYVGTKKELFERLQLAYEEQDMGQGSPLDNEELLDDDDVLAEDESLDEELADAESMVKPSPPPLKRKAVTAPAEVLPVKKIVLNRTAAASSEKENLDNSEDGGKLDGSDPAKRDLVKISSVPLTAKERLELRASKFGVSLSPDAKKEVRAARFGSASSAAAAAAAPANIDALKKRAERFGASVSSTLTKVELDEKLRKRQERFGVVEPAGAKAKPAAGKTPTPAAAVTSSSSSVKVPITFGASTAAAASKPDDDIKKKRADRFKATL